MPDSNHILTVTYNEKALSYRTKSIYMGDYGQIIAFEGFNLPEYFEVHFGTQDGTSITVIGSNNQVEIPNSLIRRYGIIPVWVYLHDTMTDGETRYAIEIPVKRRATISDEYPSEEEQSALTQALAAMQNVITTAEAVATASEVAKTAAEVAQGKAETAQAAAEIAKSSAETSATAAANSASAAETSATEASASAGTAADMAADATNSASDSAGYSLVSEGWAKGTQNGIAVASGTYFEDNARYYKEQAEASATAAAGSATNAANSATDANASRTAADQDAADAVIAKNTAVAARDAAIQSAGGASDSAGAAAQSATDAATSATQAASSATSAANSATDAAASASAASATEGRIATEGATQIAAVQAKGTEVINSIPADYTALTEQVSNLNSAIRNSVLSDSASGTDIVTFDDGAEGLPLKNLTIKLVPQQDTTASKNLLPMSLANFKSLNTTGTWNGNVYTINGVTLTVTTNDDGNVTGVTANGTATASINFRISSSAFALDTACVMTGCPSSDTTTWHLMITNTDTAYYYDESGSGVDLIAGNYGACVLMLTSGMEYSNVPFYPMIRLATDTDSTFEPYKAIRPISGFDTLNVVRTGKNLLPPFGSAWKKGSTATYKPAVTSDDAPTFPFTYGTSTYNNVPLYVLACDPNTTYTITPPTGLKAIVGEYAALEDVTSRSNILAWWTASSSAFGVSVTATTTANTHYLVIGFTNYNGSASITVDTDSEMQFEVGSEATDYEVGSIQTIPISFSTITGDTVYGGTVTVNQDGSGTVTVTHKVLEMDGVTDFKKVVSKGSGTATDNFYYNLTDADPLKTDTGIISTALMAENCVFANMAPVVASFGADVTEISLAGYVGSSGYFQPRIVFPLSEGISTVALANQWLNDLYTAGTPFTFSYKLKEPVSYSLTAEQVTTLLGYNRITVDGADGLEAEYFANTKLYIQRLTKPTEDDMTANNNIAANVFFMVGNRLFLSTTAIAAGATIAPGSNCTELSLADALNSLNV